MIPTYTELLETLRYLADQYENATGFYPQHARDLIEKASVPQPTPPVDHMATVIAQYRKEENDNRSAGGAEPCWTDKQCTAEGVKKDLQ